MADYYFQELFAERIGGRQFGKDTAIYKFEKIKRAKKEAAALHPERALLDFGIGENDDMADGAVRRVLQHESDQIGNRGYADNGIIEFKQAAAQFMQRQFRVSLDPVNEIVHCIGTKSALSLLPACFINPGDVTLMTAPGYPVAGTHTRYYGGEVFNLPLLASNGFLPDLAAVPGDLLRRTKLLVLNYPNSPTGALASRDFFKRVVDFAAEHKIIVVHDAAHIMLTYQAEPLSFLEIEGAKEVGVELHSMSKGFDMIGWRLGFVAGHDRLIAAFSTVKDNADSGQFIPIQKAACAALDDPQIPTRIRSKYQRRLSKLVTVLNDCGFSAVMPGGSYFLYVAAPAGVAGTAAFDTAEAAAQYLIREHSICTVPWDDAGAYLRFSVTYQAADQAQEDQLMLELRARLSGLGFYW